MAQPVGLGMKRNKEKTMKHLIIGLAIGLTLGLVCSAYAITKRTINAEPFTLIMSERNFINTTKVTTEDGTYRIFTIEGTDKQGGVGITAVKIE